MKAAERHSACHSCDKEYQWVLDNNCPPKKPVTPAVRIIRLVPSVILFAIIPKCPVCLAGYVMLASGVGISITAATYLRTALIILCLVSMVYFITKIIRHFIERRIIKKIV